MSLFAISDLHLSGYDPKPMDIFDTVWKNHTEKILYNWNNTVNNDDYVLVPGDLTWGGNMKEAKPDLDFIANLNGSKIFIKGNHDYFWGSTQRLNELYDNMYFIKNSYYDYNGIAICGTRGWVCPNDSRYTDHDYKIYMREINRLKISIKSALNKGYNDIIVCLHFPPTNDKKENSLFIETLKEYNIKRVIYGHLHGNRGYNASLLGNAEGIEYSLVSADYLQFKPIKIM